MRWMRRTKRTLRFLSTPSARRATMLRGELEPIGFLFLSTPSARRATRTSTPTSTPSGYFYPRPPRGGRPKRPGSRPGPVGDFYPRPPRGGRLPFSTFALFHLYISIHALREEGDFLLSAFYICSFLFLSTPSARRATISILASLGCRWNFYPRPPRGGRLLASRVSSMFFTISIHALREEGDPLTAESKLHTAYFYPRPPRGGRRQCGTLGAIGGIFLSTPSARRATGADQWHQRQHCISIHALREEGDARCSAWAERPDGFLSTPSARRATEEERDRREREFISIHALREEGDARSAPSHRER